MAATMLCGALGDGSGFDRLYPVRVAAAVVALGAFRGWVPELRRGFGWEAPTIGVVVYALWVALEATHPTGTDAPPAGLKALPGVLASCWLALRVVGSVATVPLAEELVFRGYLTRRLMAADFRSVPPGTFSWTSFLASSLAFGLLHDGRWVAGTAAGMFYACAYYRRGRLGDAVVAHATTNALIALDVLAREHWSLWA
jgi:CAAX prenyl protease-like protein